MGIKDNLRKAIKEKGLYVKEIAALSGVKKRTIDQWIGLDETEPKVKDFYAVCKTLNITMEQAVAGEKGAEYVREWARNDGETWQPPDRIKDIVDVLGHIDDDTLETVRTMVVPLMAKRGGISSDAKTA